MNCDTLNNDLHKLNFYVAALEYKVDGPIFKPIAAEQAAEESTSTEGEAKTTVDTIDENVFLKPTRKDLSVFRINTMSKSV